MCAEEGDAAYEHEVIMNTAGDRPPPIITYATTQREREREERLK